MGGAAGAALPVAAPAVSAPRRHSSTPKAEAAYAKWLWEHDAAAPDALAGARVRAAAEAMGLAPVSLILIRPWHPALIGVDAVARSLASIAAQVSQPVEILAPASMPLPAQATVRQDGGETLGELVELSRGAFVTFLAAGDELSPVALLAMVLRARQAPNAVLFYSDEDERASGANIRRAPYFKGRAEIDLALAQDYLCRLSMLPAAVARQSVQGRPATEAGLYLSVTAALLHHGPGAIEHLPWVLYHRAARRQPPCRTSPA